MFNSSFQGRLASWMVDYWGLKPLLVKFTLAGTAWEQDRLLHCRNRTYRCTIFLLALLYTLQVSQLVKHLI